MTTYLFIGLILLLAAYLVRARRDAATTPRAGAPRTARACARPRAPRRRGRPRWRWPRAPPRTPRRRTSTTPSPRRWPSRPELDPRGDHRRARLAASGRDLRRLVDRALVSPRDLLRAGTGGHGGRVAAHGALCRRRRPRTPPMPTCRAPRSGPCPRSTPPPPTSGAPARPCGRRTTPRRNRRESTRRPSGSTRRRPPPLRTTPRSSRGRRRPRRCPTRRRSNGAPRTPSPAPTPETPELVWAAGPSIAPEPEPPVSVWESSADPETPRPSAGRVCAGGGARHGPRR